MLTESSLSKKVADGEKDQAVEDLTNRFKGISTAIDTATAGEVGLLREQLSKQDETLTAAYATLVSEMPVESLIMRRTLASYNYQKPPSAFVSTKNGRTFRQEMNVSSDF